MTERPRPSVSCAPPDYPDRTVKQELRANLLARLGDGEPLFPGVVGFDDSVLPALERGILAGHDLILLGERGQAKTRLVRAMVNLLDEFVPAIAGYRDQRSPLPADLRPREGAGGRARRRDAESPGSPARTGTPRSSPRPTRASAT